MKQFRIGQATSSFVLEWGLVRLFSYIALARLSYAIFSLPSETVLPGATSSIISSFYALTSNAAFSFVAWTLLLITLFLVVSIEVKLIKKNTNRHRKISIIVSKVALIVFSLYGIPASIAIGAVFTRIPMQSAEGAYFGMIAVLFFAAAFVLWISQKLSEATESRMLLIATFTNRSSPPRSDFRELCYSRYTDLLTPFKRFTSYAEAETVDSHTYMLIAGYDKPLLEWPPAERDKFLLFMKALEVEFEELHMSVNFSYPVKPNIHSAGAAPGADQLITGLN